MLIILLLHVHSDESELLFVLFRKTLIVSARQLKITIMQVPCLAISHQLCDFN
jgi:hypothetical protein